MKDYLVRINQAPDSELQGAARYVGLENEGLQYSMAIKDGEPSVGQRKLLAKALTKRGYSSISTVNGVSVPSREQV